MPLFSYTAINAENQRVSGTVSAMSLQAARDALKEMHLVPEEIHEALPSAPATIPDDVATRISAIPAKEPIPAAASFDLPPSSTEGHSQVPSPPPIPNNVRAGKSQVPSPYFPLLDTLRLYAGWLLAWYGFVYALGSYQHSRPLPFTVPYVEGLFLSPLVLSFTLGAFLFLLLTGIWKAIGPPERSGRSPARPLAGSDGDRAGRGILSGFVLTILGIAVFVLYRMNVV